MKKIHLILAGVLICLYLIACNDGVDNNSSTDSTSHRNTVASNPPDPCEGIDDIDLCKDAGEIGNLVIETSVAQKMMTNFETFFKTEGGKNIRAFEPVYWLDKCTIESIAEYLRTQTDPVTKKRFDGIRIFIACEIKDNAYYGTDPYKRRTSINIFPTYYEKAASSNKSDHKTSKQKISLVGICSSAYLQDFSVADPQNKAFKKIYRKEATPQLKNNLSESIWIDACIIYTLEKLIKLPNANIDGANVNMAAYDNAIQPTNPVRGRYTDIQSTVLVVPTHLVGGKHEDYWYIVDCLFKHAKANGWAPAPPGGFNHGELCPQVCE